MTCPLPPPPSSKLQMLYSRWCSQEKGGSLSPAPSLGLQFYSGGGRPQKSLILPSYPTPPPAPCCRSSGTGEGLEIPSPTQIPFIGQGLYTRLRRVQEYWSFNLPSPTQMSCRVEGACMEGKAKKGLPSFPQCPCTEWRYHSGRCELLSPTPALTQ